MNRNKIYTTIIAALSATIMFTGCGATTETKVPLEVVGSVPPATITTLETMPTTETVPVTEPTAPFEQGQEVFVVYAHEGGTGLRRFFVVTVEGDVVIVTTAIPGSSEAGELLSFPIANCYGDSADAWAAADKEPLE